MPDADELSRMANEHELTAAMMEAIGELAAAANFRECAKVATSLAKKPEVIGLTLSVSPETLTMLLCEAVRDGTSINDALGKISALAALIITIGRQNGDQITMVADGFAVLIKITPIEDDGKK